MVRVFSGGGGALGLGGCGTSASRPRGVVGTITMKMMSNTSNTSINGVTLMSDATPPEDPAVIPIAICSLLALREVARPKRGSGSN
jgi:hypothetical protein